MALYITRLKDRGKERDKMKILIATQTVYLNHDKTKVVEANSPEAAWLLVREGSPIEPTVAEFYGVSTREGVAISKVSRDADEEKAGMVTDGTNNATDKNYERMKAYREARESVKANTITGGNPLAGKQASIMAEAVANQATGNVGENYKNASDALAVGATGNVQSGEQQAESGIQSKAGESEDKPAAVNSKTKEIKAPGESAAQKEEGGDNTDATSKLLEELKEGGEFEETPDAK